MLALFLKAQRVKITLWIITLLIAFLLPACEDEVNVLKKPSIELKKGGDYTSANRSAFPDDTLQVGIMAESGTRGKLVLFEIYRNGETMESIEINRNSLDADLFIVKDTLQTELWKFLVRDRSNYADSVSLTLTLADTTGT